MSRSGNVMEFVAGGLEKRYKCIQCHNVLQDPVQPSCGHRFCLSCLDDIFKQTPPGEAKCPDDGEVLKREEVFRDKCAQKEILGLECYCPNKSLGCLWTGLLARLQDHDSECPYTKVKCLYGNLGCDVVILRHQLAKHVENDCVYVVTECPFCHVGYPGVKMREHLEDCGKFPVKCPHDCGESEIPRENIPEHLLSCPGTPTPCRLKFIGCDFEGSRDSVHEHLRSYTTEHLILFVEYFKMITLQNKEILSAQRKSIDEIRQQLSLQNESLVLNKQALSTHQYKLDKVKEDVEIVHQSVEQLNQAPPRLHSADVRGFNQAPAHPHYAASASAGGSNHQFDRVEHSLALREIQPVDQDLKLQIMETTSYDGVFLWKIDEFQRRFREAVDGKTLSIYSPPFYTARYGYKLCAGASLNGDGMALFFIVMRGEHDGSLEWPFQETITIKLLDEEKTCQALQTFRPDPNSSSVQQPMSYMNIASCCPMFCPIRLLRSRCVHDDSILIEITVSTSRSGMPTIQRA